MSKVQSAAVAAHSTEAGQAQGGALTADIESADAELAELGWRVLRQGRAGQVAFHLLGPQPLDAAREG